MKKLIYILLITSLSLLGLVACEEEPVKEPEDTEIESNSDNESAFKGTHQIEIEVKNYGNYKIAGTKLTSGDSQIFLPENMKEEFSENYLKFNFGQVLEKINLSSKIGANFGMIIYNLCHFAKLFI